jgi:hypothetical protein
MTLRALLASLLFFSLQAQAGICTREYAPVCGQLQQQHKTFANRCMMKGAGASWVSDGECPVATSDAPAKSASGSGTPQ